MDRNQDRVARKAAIIQQAVENALEHHRAGRIDEADRIYGQVLAFEPLQPDALHLRGVIAVQRGDWARALDLLRFAVLLNPAAAQFRSSYGNCLHVCGMPDEAEENLRAAVSMNPADATALHRLANVLIDQRRLHEAADVYRRAVALNPNSMEWHNSLGVLLSRIGRFGEAQASFQKRVELDPSSALAHSNLAVAMLRQGRAEEAITIARKAVSLDPLFSGAWSNLLLTELYCPSLSPPFLRAEAERWVSACLGQIPQVTAFGNARDPEKRLKIGFVSADFRNHPVSLFLEPLLAVLDRSHFEIFCYSDVAKEGDMTARIRRSCDHWRPIAEKCDTDVAAAIRSDSIDVLIDLGGHTAGNRLAVFAGRAAPLQMTWLGYPGTTGVPAMDYIISDSHVIPPGDEAFYTEKPLRLPCGFASIGALRPRLPLDAPPETGTVITFGSFNNLAKISTSCITAWSDIMRRTPDSRLFLNYLGVDEDATAARLRSVFHAQGVDPGRLRLEFTSPRSNTLAAYRTVDIALDTFPFNGATTTIEALWMGVPVISVCGDRFAARMGASILSGAGLAEFIAATPADYVAKASQLASDRGALALAREQLRNRLSSCPDLSEFSTDFGAAIRTAWREHCLRRP